MNEFSKKIEVQETKLPEVTAFKEIKPETELSPSEARSALESIIAEVRSDEFYSTAKERIDRSPADNPNPNGHWEGERGNSKFVPSSETEKGQAGISKLAEYGKDGIVYHNGEPDYSECSEATVQIDNMTEHRADYEDANGVKCDGNFTQADKKCAEQWNIQQKDGRTDWDEEGVAQWRAENRCSWHECCDTKTMHLVSRDIHGADTSVYLHWGGCAECKRRDSITSGGGFDE